MPAAVDARAPANVRFMFHLANGDRRQSVQVDIEETLIAPIAYKLFTKSAQSSGSENIGPRERSWVFWRRGR